MPVLYSWLGARSVGEAGGGFSTRPPSPAAGLCATGRPGQVDIVFCLFHHAGEVFVAIL